MPRFCCVRRLLSQISLPLTILTLSLTPVSQANAIPFTYTFTTPYWTRSHWPTEFGDGLSFTLTLDNGSSTNANQSYNFSDIVALSAQAQGGTFVLNLSEAEIPTLATHVDSLVSPITTDSNGIATYAMQAPIPGSDTGRIFAADGREGNGRLILQLGQWGTDGGFLPVWIYVEEPYLVDASLEAPFDPSTGSYSQLSLVAQPQATPTSVPEPAEIALVGVALAALGLLKLKGRRAGRRPPWCRSLRSWRASRTSPESWRSPSNSSANGESLNVVEEMLLTSRSR